MPETSCQTVPPYLPEAFRRPRRCRGVIGLQTTLEDEGYHRHVIMSAYRNLKRVCGVCYEVCDEANTLTHRCEGEQDAYLFRGGYSVIQSSNRRRFGDGAKRNRESLTIARKKLRSFRKAKVPEKEIDRRGQVMSRFDAKTYQDIVENEFKFHELLDA